MAAIEKRRCSFKNILKNGANERQKNWQRRITYTPPPYTFHYVFKLKEFKSRRRREMLLNKPKELFLGIMERISSKENVTPDSCEIKSPLLSTSNSLSDNSRVREEDEASILSVASDDTTISLMPNSWLNVMTNILYFILWVITFLIAVHLEFGFVYLVLSGLAFIYYNTRTGPKKKGEISAYSVFNPGCEAIDGTLKAEQLEREFNLIQH